jgi:hypothetical protein
LAHFGGKVMVAKHIQRRGHTKDQRLAQSVLGKDMVVGVDQPRQQGSAGTIDHLGAFGRLYRFADGGNQAILCDDSLGGDDCLAVKEANVLKN